VNLVKRFKKFHYGNRISDSIPCVLFTSSFVVIVSIVVNNFVALYVEIVYHG
jgi:hypothetical protein